MECLGGDVNRMKYGMGWSGVSWVMRNGGWGDGGCEWDWAIVYGVCYYRNLLQMQQLHPIPRPRLVITNYADNAH